MLAVERRKAILEKIKNDGNATVSDLSAQFEVTEETVRRDLQELEKRGLVLRIHGGAVPFDEGLPDLSADVRETVNTEGKKAIAKEAARYIKSGDTIFLDASTTVMFLAREIKNLTDITIITNSLRVINELSLCEGIKLICTGGTFYENNKSFVGISAQNTIKEFYAEKCFVSCAGVTPDGGMLDSREEEGILKKLMFQNSNSVILLCDKTKIGRIRTYKIAPLSRADMIITDIESGETADTITHICANTILVS